MQPRYKPWKLAVLMVFLLGTFALLVWFIARGLAEGRREVDRRAQPPQQSTAP